MREHAVRRTRGCCASVSDVGLKPIWRLEHMHLKFPFVDGTSNGGRVREKVEARGSLNLASSISPQPAPLELFYRSPEPRGRSPRGKPC